MTELCVRCISATFGPGLQIQFHRAAVGFEGEVLEFFPAWVAEVPAMNFAIAGFDRIEGLDFHYKEHIRDGQNETLVDIFIRERTQIRHRPDLQSNLFKHFSMQSVFGRFARVNKSTGQSEFSLAWIFSSDQQQYLSVRICSDRTDRRDRSEEMGVTAGFAVERVLSGLCRGCSASRTELPCLANRSRTWSRRRFRRTGGLLLCHDVSFRHSAKEARSMDRPGFGNQ